MQVPESWLRTLVDPKLTTEELAHLLTMSGLEVESCVPVAPAFAGVVVGAVERVEKHPHADRLTVCTVDAGRDAPLTIVCGAPNVTVGMRAPVAVVGARLPGQTPSRPLDIAAADVRGVRSQGMLCSAAELGLSGDHGGLLALAADAPVGMDVRTWLTLDDHIFTVKLTPNRPDCLSALGLAREVSALTGASLKPPDIHPVVPTSPATFPVRISAPDGCGRFTGRVICNVSARAATPEWMRARLERAGQRSISALVDVTNYVMLELGRPLHVYDLDKLSGAIDVRFARSGEHLKLLNEQVVELAPDVLAIVDDSGPIGLAGIMGGDSTKADLTTRNVFLEAAFFYPDAIAGRARRYNFTSDAAHRFERGVDFDNNVDGIERATQLIVEYCGGEPGPVVDTVAQLPERPLVRMRIARAHRIIGVPVPASDMADIFTRLRLPHRREADEALVVTPPSFRFDLQVEEDLVEEVARVYGFERIPASLPRTPAVVRAETETHRPLHALRGQLALTGYQETINFSFVEPAWEEDFAGNSAPIKLLNPIASHLSVMRSTLIGGLVDNLRYNLNRKLARVRVFEIGRVFLRAAGQGPGPLEVADIRQPMRVAAAAIGPESEPQWGLPIRSVDFFDAKGDLEMLLGAATTRFEPGAHPAFHPGRGAQVLVNGIASGWIGELHPKWQQKYELPVAPVLFEIAAAALQHIKLPRYEVVSRFPPVVRDLAVEVDETLPVASLLEDLRAHAPPVVEQVQLFDLYRGPGLENGRKSLAFRVLLQDTQRTLTDAEVDSAVQQLVARLEREFGAKLRK